MAIEFIDPAALNDNELADLIVGELRLSLAYRAEALAANIRALDMYMAQDNPAFAPRVGTGDLEEDEALMSNTFLPVGAVIANTAIQNIWMNTLGDIDYLRCEAQNPDDWKGAMFCSRHLKNRHRQMGFKTKMWKLILEAVLYDYAIAINHWRLEGGFVQKRVESERQIEFPGGAKLVFGGAESVEVFDPMKIDRVQTDVLTNLRTFFDPNAVDNFEDSAFFIDVRDEDPNTLLANRKTKDNPDGIYTFDPSEIDFGTSQLFARVGDRKDQRTAQRTMASTLGNTTRKVHVVRRWSATHAIEMTGNHKIIRKQPLTGWPLVKFEMHPLPNRFEGMGIMQLVERMAVDINAIVNNRRDYQNMVLDPMAIIDDSLLGADENPKLYPGRMFRSLDGEAKGKVEIVKPGADIGSATTEEVNLELGFSERAAGISTNAQQQLGSGRRTATEVVEVSKALNVRMGSASLLLEMNALEPIYDQQLYLERKFMKRRQVFQQTGPEGAYFWQVDPDMMAFHSNPVFTALGMSHIIKTAQERAQLANISSFVMSNPALARHVNEREIVNVLFKEFRPADWDKFLRAQPQGSAINIPPEIEHLMMVRGHKIEVSQENNHFQHATAHDNFMTTEDFQLWPEMLKQKLIRHARQHKAVIQQSVGSTIQTPNGRQGGPPVGENATAQGSAVAETQVNLQGVGNGAAPVTA